MKFTRLTLATATLLAFTTAFGSDSRIGPLLQTPSMSPSAQEVVFASDLDGPRSLFHLWIARADGSDLRRLRTDPGASADEEPAWSPDGKTIAFASTVNGATELWTAAPDGSRLMQLTHGAQARQPAWSPDGRWIAYVSSVGGSNDIWMLRPDGSDARRITRMPGEEDHPSFSPDGQRLVFSMVAGELATLATVRLDGSDLKQITPAGAADWNPSWGMQGIVFSSNRESVSGHWQLWTVQPDGSGLRRLGSVTALDPAWTSSGSIVHTDETRPRVALSSIAVFDPRSGVTRDLVNVNGYVARIDLRPRQAVNRVNPASRGTVTVAILSSRDFDAMKQVNRATITFGHDGSEPSLRRCNSGRVDVNGDGLPDLVCRFSIAALRLAPGDTNLTLRFKDNDGAPYEGKDSVHLTSDDDPDGAALE